MTVLLALHAVAAVLAPALARRIGRRAFLVVAAVPAASFGWFATQVPAVLDGRPLHASAPWIPDLGVELALRVDALSLLLVALVTGVGALVLAFSGWYFDRDDPANGRTAGLLVAFAGAMLGLAVADDLVLLYVFWEATTVLSFLLIGGAGASRGERRSATQAIVVTAGGGLAMLVGIILLGETAGTFRLSEIVAGPPAGPLPSAAMVLLVVGALTKSALVPFHFWLPAAMVAPTPISAYLHAAAMVKAGVFLVARLAPAFADLDLWRALLLPLGVATMLLGGYRALRQVDLKLLLAYGTVSQLGFLVVLLAEGTQVAAAAGAALLLAHGLFKAALFLVVGVVDHATGTRDLRELSGLGRAAPALATVAILAAASMAGVPPLLGFVAKEGAYEAFLLSSRPGASVVLAGLVAGSALTVAYSARLVWGAFARRPGVAPTEPHGVGLAALAAPGVLAVAGLALGPGAALVDAAVAPYAALLPVLEHPYHLALWHGLGSALLLSGLSLAAGAALFAARAPAGRLQDAVPAAPDAGELFWRLVHGLDAMARRVTATTQTGSLALYLAVILATLVLVQGLGLAATRSWPGDLLAWDVPAQVVPALAVVGSALLVPRMGSRVGAALVVGACGYGVAMLFVIAGAPDLALTQLLVETVTLVAIVLVARTLPKRFAPRRAEALPGPRVQRGLAVLVGVVMALLAVAASGARTAEPVSAAYPEAAYDFGGGRNVVNVILVDIRAWDTLGEVAVLVVAATGVASLVFLRQRTGAPPRWRREERPSRAERVDLAGAPGRDPAVHDDPVDGRPAATWLQAGGTLVAARRSVVLEVVVRLVFPTVMALSLYLLFAGHNQPGGGFAGGLVAGLALTMRYVAAGRYELGEAAPVDAGRVMGLGMLLAGGTGAAGLLLGGQVLESAILEGSLPLLGDVKLVTSLVFDVGVYLIVIGLVLDILRSLGAGVDRQAGQP